jgi:hypothetical protein
MSNLNNCDYPTVSVLFQVDNITFDGGPWRLQCRKYNWRTNEPRRLAGYKESVKRLNRFAKPPMPIKYKAKMAPTPLTASVDVAEKS